MIYFLLVFNYAQMPVDCLRAFETGDSKIHVSEPNGFKCKNKLLFL